VLPLTNISSSADDEYFADGMTEDIIAQPSKVASLKVTSRTSVMRYKKPDLPMGDIAKALGASHVVEGTVRRAGSRLRIVAQLIEAASDAHLWAQTFDRELTDVFAVQTEVAEQIAVALRATLSSDERVRLEQRATRDIQAYNLYLLGRFHFGKHNIPDWRHSMSTSTRPSREIQGSRPRTPRPPRLGPGSSTSVERRRARDLPERVTPRRERSRWMPRLVTRTCHSV